MLNRELLFETGFTGFQFTNSSTIVAYVFVDKAVESELLPSQLNELISFGKNIAFFNPYRNRSKKNRQNGNGSLILPFYIIAQPTPKKFVKSQCVN